MGLRYGHKCEFCGKLTESRMHEIDVSITLEDRWLSLGEEGYDTNSSLSISSTTLFACEDCTDAVTAYISDKLVSLSPQANDEDYPVLKHYMEEVWKKEERDDG